MRKETTTPAKRRRLEKTARTKAEGDWDDDGELFATTTLKAKAASS